ncbi:MAG TPA: DNA mismatch repair protein MutS, partial [Clostridia bacterium]
MANLTPMMQQYLDVKEQYSDCILFFRLGDFYEMFFSDAETASRELEITLTGRDCGLAERAPMCGVPFHSADTYITRLINKGFKVAICEQVEDPNEAKGIVRREVIKVVTPGTVTESSMLDDKKNNYLMSIYRFNTYHFGIASVDISTGEFFSTSINWGNTIGKLMDEIARFLPAEIVVNRETYEDENLTKEIKQRFNTYITHFDEECFGSGFSEDRINSHFEEKKDFEFEGNIDINASGALLEYLYRTQKAGLPHIRTINRYRIEDYMVLDVTARRNLEISETMRDKSKKGTLLWVLDRTMTSMGARTLRRWVDQPLINKSDIDFRLDAVEELKSRFMMRMELRELLKKVYDMERLLSRVILQNANGRDLTALKVSIGQIPNIKGILSDAKSGHLFNNFNELDTLDDVYELIEASIIDEPPVSVKDGGIIKTGYNEDVDRLRNASVEGKTWIAQIEAQEKEKTGIRNLKVGFNKVFGYFIEVTKSNINNVPDYYIRKQTLANCERYITDEL